VSNEVRIELSYFSLEVSEVSMMTSESTISSLFLQKWRHHCNFYGELREFNLF